MGNIFGNLSNSSKNSSSSLINSLKDSCNGPEKGYKTHQELTTFNWYDTIKNKLLEREGNSLGELSEEEFDNLINSLGDEKLFLDRFLKLEEVYNDENLKQATKDLREIKDLQENNFTPSKEEMNNMFNNLLEHRRNSEKFNVYFFISKIGLSDSPFFRVLAKDVLKNKYGMFHVGLEIDGIVLEWGTGDAGPHLIYPRINLNRISKRIARFRINYDSCFSREFIHATNTLLQYLPDFLTQLIELLARLINHVTYIGVAPSQKLQVIAQKCVYWNKYMYYNKLSNNCQHFIEQILKKLDLKFEPQGEFKKFLDRIIYNADDSFLFQEREFFSRQDLDQYADQNWNTIQNIWDKRLLLSYSDMMESMYQLDGNSKWGPMRNKQKWYDRENELREN